MANRILSSLAGDGIERYHAMLSVLPGETIRKLFQDGALSASIPSEVTENWRELSALATSTDELGGLQSLELRSTLPDELLLYADKLSMASGLEVRVPYLDHDVVEYVERLGSSFKIRGRSQKWLHRRVARKLLSPAVLDRPKLGFETPSGAWFRDAGGAQLADCIADPQSNIYSFLRYDAVRSLLQQHRSNRANFGDTLFSIGALELWLRNANSQICMNPDSLVIIPNG
jgi:asparagine synthase (glutamine-hydrolysing)